MYRPSWISCYMKIGWFFNLGPHPNIQGVPKKLHDRIFCLLVACCPHNDSLLKALLLLLLLCYWCRQPTINYFLNLDQGQDLSHCHNQLFQSLSLSHSEERGQPTNKKFYHEVFVGPLSRVRPRNGILGLVLVVVLVLPLRSEFIGEL